MRPALKLFAELCSSGLQLTLATRLAILGCGVDIVRILRHWEAAVLRARHTCTSVTMQHARKPKPLNLEPSAKSRHSQQTSKSCSLGVHDALHRTQCLNPKRLNSFRAAQKGGVQHPDPSGLAGFGFPHSLGQHPPEPRSLLMLFEPP